MSFTVALLLAPACLVVGGAVGATLTEHAHATVTPAQSDARPTSPDADTTPLEEATTYLTGDVQLHIVEIDGRHWVSADPDLGEEVQKYLGGDVYRTIQEYDDSNSE